MPAAPFAINKCDGPVQPDGTWQRCVTFQQTAGSLPSYLTTTNCQTLGPDAHIDGQTTHWLCEGRSCHYEIDCSATAVTLQHGSGWIVHINSVMSVTPISSI